MNIPDEAAERYPINEHTGEVPFHAKMRRGAFLEGAVWARKEALREAADLVTMLAPYNCELNPDGTEDRITAAWVEGIHDSWSAIRALAEEASDARQ